VRQPFVVAGFLAVVAGCAPTMVQMSLAPADMEAATAMLASGTSTIKGSALIRQRGGGVVTCAGNEIFLIPATPSATSELRRVFGDDKGYVPRGGDATLGGGKLVVPPRPNRPGVCNAQGFFTFPNIRAGKWYVMTSVIWTVGDQYQGGSMLSSAEVREGQEIEIVISQ
jgi:hypothetical protein